MLLFEKTKHTSFGNVKRTIKEQIRETPETTISGYLGAIEGWEDEKTSKFAIKTETGHRFTIRYDRSEALDKEVTARMWSSVKLERRQIGRSWYLVRWIEE